MFYRDKVVLPEGGRGGDGEEGGDQVGREGVVHWYSLIAGW